MSTTQEISPYLRQELRPLQTVERMRGIVRKLTEEERNAVILGAEEWSCEMRNTDGAPDDARYHLRRYFELLREQVIACQGDLAKAIDAVDYEYTREEKEYWEACARAELRHTAYCRAMAGKGVGW